MNKTRPTRKEIITSFLTLARAFPERRAEFEGEAFRFTVEGFDLSVLGLSTRIQNVLRKHGHNTTLQITHWTGRELERLILLEGIGVGSVEEIKKAVSNFLAQ